MDPLTKTPHAPNAAARQRIDAARARWERWSRAPGAIGLEPEALDPLANAIEAAEDALWAVACLGHTQTAAQKALKRALANLWRVEDGLRRAIAAYAAKTEDPTVRRQAGLPVPPAPRGDGVPLVAVIRSARRLPHGRVELAIACPMLGVARGLHVQVLRRGGSQGSYAPIGITWTPSFVDENAHEGGDLAAYKVVARRHGNRGPASPRVIVPLPRRAPTNRATTLRRNHPRAAA